MSEVETAIEQEAANHRIRPAAILGASQRSVVVRARHAAMWRVRQIQNEAGEPKYSLPQIGRFFGRDHTSVLNALRRHEERAALESAEVADIPLAQRSRQLRASLYVIGEADGGALKVGIAFRPRARLNELRTSNPHDLQLLHVSRQLSREEALFVERATHAILKSHRISREWFNCSLEQAHDAVADAFALLNLRP